MSHPNSDPNPYQSPQMTPVTPQVAPSNTQGVWSDGKYLVVSQGATLPSVCVLTNQKSERAINRNFYWHHPAVYLVIFVGLLFYVILALVLRKSHKLAVPLSEPALQKRKKSLVMCWIIGLLSAATIVGAIVGLSTEAFGRDNEVVGIILIIGAFLGLLVTAVIGGRFAGILVPKKITNQAGWFKGASQEYLARFPSLPPNMQ